MLTMILCSMLGSNDFRVREFASNHTPWQVIVLCVPRNHPDPEVRLRWRKAVPKWYQELTPEFLTILVKGSDFNDDAVCRRFLSVAWRYTYYTIRIGDTAEPGWCLTILDNLRTGLPQPMEDKDETH